jgi:hypothetical protein
MDITISNAIITVIISASVAIGIFGLKERWIEPSRWKKNIKKEIIDKKLEAYGTLITIIQAYEENAKNDSICKQEGFTHVIPISTDDKLDGIIERFRHYLTNELIDEYLQFIQTKKTFLSYSGRDNTVKSSATYCKLSKIQEIAENTYVDLKEEYEKLTGYKLNTET